MCLIDIFSSWNIKCPICKISNTQKWLWLNWATAQREKKNSCECLSTLLLYWQLKECLKIPWDIAAAVLSCNRARARKQMVKEPPATGDMRQSSS